MHIPRLMIAGTQSGVGKTTLVTGLLRALSEKGLTVQAFKVGPDYIDPGFHRLASGRPSYNLDSWLMPQEELKRQFVHYSQNCDLAIIEGVMGLYDGGKKGISSSAEIAKLLETPVVLVLDVKSMGESAAALALGYKLYDQKVPLAGVILNRLGSDSHEMMIRQGLNKIGIPVFGAVRRQADIALEERHLGLTPVTEVAVTERIEKMSQLAQTQLDLHQLREAANSAPDMILEARLRPAKEYRVTLGVAQDEVFSFYYEDSLKVLQELGAEIVPFSPLHDHQIPQVQGLILGGGFPEMFMKELSQNAAMKESIHKAHQNGMPILAECGGLMYLCRSITDFNGLTYNMAGLIPAQCQMEKRLQTVGYVEAKLMQDEILGQAGQVLRGHEFHFSKLIPAEGYDGHDAFCFTKLRTGQTYLGGYSHGNLLASYLHLHFAGHRQAAELFLEKCSHYQQ